MKTPILDDMIFQAADAFTDILGNRRGNPNNDEPDILLAPMSFTRTLFKDGLPSGLTLITGDSGSGKSVSAVVLAAEAAEEGRKVFYLDPDASNIQDLISAQTASENIHVMRPITGFLENERNTLLEIPADVIIIDSLESAFGRDLPHYVLEQTKAVLELSHKANLTVIGTCKDYGWLVNGLKTPAVSKTPFILATNRKDGISTSEIICKTVQWQGQLPRQVALSFDWETLKSKLR